MSWIWTKYGLSRLIHEPARYINTHFLLLITNLNKISTIIVNARDREKKLISLQGFLNKHIKIVPHQDALKVLERTSVYIWAVHYDHNIKSIVVVYATVVKVLPS